MLTRPLLKVCLDPLNVLSVAEFAKKWEAYSHSVSSADTVLGVYTDVQEMCTGTSHSPALDGGAFVIERCKPVSHMPCTWHVEQPIR